MLQQMITYPEKLKIRDKYGNLPLHRECKRKCRSSTISQCIELYPESLAEADRSGLLPLHILLENESSFIDDVMMMMEKYPAAVTHKTRQGDLPLHIECRTHCRSSVISTCIELYPESLAQATMTGYLPLQTLLWNKSSSMDDALMMIEKYPAALRHHTSTRYKNYLPLHIECKSQCRSTIISKCIELYPEALAKIDVYNRLPLHKLLQNTSSTADNALMVIEKYPAALQHRDSEGYLPLHIECKNQCRSSIISKCIELYPESLAQATMTGYLPLHSLLWNKSSSMDDALMMIEKYPAALQHHTSTRYQNYLPLHIECKSQCRSTIISKCIELYPEALAKIDVYNG
jgi:ankyrin repeat protein